MHTRAALDGENAVIRWREQQDRPTPPMPRIGKRSAQASWAGGIRDQSRMDMTRNEAWGSVREPDSGTPGSPGQCKCISSGFKPSEDTYADTSHRHTSNDFVTSWRSFRFFLAAYAATLAIVSIGSGGSVWRRGAMRHQRRKAFLHMLQLNDRRHLIRFGLHLPCCQLVGPSNLRHEHIPINRHRQRVLRNIAEMFFYGLVGYKCRIQGRHPFVP